MRTEEGPTDPTGPAERLAEMMAWHGMARYADPDDLAPHVRTVRDDPDEGGGPAVRA